MEDEDKKVENLIIKTFDEIERFFGKMTNYVESTSKSIENERDSKKKLTEYMMHLVEKLHNSEKSVVFWRSIALALMGSNTAIAIMIIFLGYAKG